MGLLLLLAFLASGGGGLLPLVGRGADVGVVVLFGVVELLVVVLRDRKNQINCKLEKKYPFCVCAALNHKLFTVKHRGLTKDLSSRDPWQIRVNQEMATALNSRVVRGLVFF